MRTIGIVTFVLMGLGVGFAGRAEESASTSAMIKDYGLKAYVRTSKDLPRAEAAPWKLVCEMPYNCHFQPWIEVEADAGKVIQFDSSNPLARYLTKTETWTTGAGRQQFEARNWISGEGAIYTIPAGVKVTQVQYRETGYDTTFAGSFHCDREDFNTLWQKAARTAYVCMRDHFYDCPDRERVGFWGDGTPELDQCFYIFDRRTDVLCRQLVRRPLEPKFYPGQHLEFLGRYGLWFYYLQTGDLDSIRAVYDQTRKFIFETYKFGNHGTWFDWGKENKDTAVIETCFYYDCLGTLKKMAEATGHAADVPLIDRKMEQTRASFDQRFWKGGYYMSAQVTNPDDRANAMAVNSGLADRSKWTPIFENVLSKKAYASCFFDRWVFEALCAMGRPDDAMRRMGERYRTMVPCSFTTLWEHYDRWWASQIDAFDEGSSLNHGWNPPALLLSQTIAGITPTAPGWAEFQVLPRDTFLKSIQVVVPSIKGDVRVEIEKTKREYALAVVSPANTKAVVGVPKKAFRSIKAIRVRGKVVWDGAFHERVDGVNWVGEDAGYLEFDVAPGKWKFVATGELVDRGTMPPLSLERPATKPLEKKGWSASASVPDASAPFSGDNIPIDYSAANAIDGDHWTGWRDMTQTQHPGQWFQVDMERSRHFSRIELDNTWALWDSPVECSVTVSEDGKHWSAPAATVKGNPGITSIKFPRQKGRFLRITQTGTNPTYHWSIFELDVFDER